MPRFSFLWGFPVPARVYRSAWRGDTRLLKQLLAAGASLDVKGVSRGKGPFTPLEWAERKV